VNIQKGIAVSQSSEVSIEIAENLILHSCKIELTVSFVEIEEGFKLCEKVVIA
jgi:hypothetical protein